VDTDAFTRLRTESLKSPVEKWGAIVSSVGSVLAYVLLLLLLYPFVDLLVWQGEVPAYGQLTAARKQEFAAEWAARPEADRAEAVRRSGLTGPLAQVVGAAADVPDQSPAAAKPAAERTRPPTAGEWELRWRAGVYLALRDKVGPEAADAFLPETPADAADPDARPRLGLLSLVIRERTRWTGSVLGQMASWNGWASRPVLGGTANQSYLTGLFILALGLAVARGLLLNAAAYLASAATLGAVVRLRRAIYQHTYRLGAVAFRAVGPAEVVGLFTRQVDAARDALYAWLTAAFRHPVQFTLLLVLILAINFWLGVCSLAVALLVWVIAGQIAAYFRREARSGSRQADVQLALLQESMGLLRLVKCYQMERFNQARVERQLAESGRAHWRRMRGHALARPLLFSAGLLAAVVLLYLAARAVLAGEFTVAGLALMAVALASLIPPAAGWLDTRLKLRRGREAAEAVYEFLDRKGEAAEASDAEFLPALTTRLEFRNITLREPGSGRPVLENLSFAVPAGARVAIVGPEPAEKRALMYLIPRFLDPTTGEIRLEDKNIRWVTHESLRAQVAVVMQDDLVFTDTVANNIGCGDPGYTLPQIIEAAKQAHAHQFIEKLPYGYETQVGEHGYTLKPGERFRIALARALLRDPSLLVIEEPAGPTDADTPALLDDTLERAGAGRTVIILAQRLSTLREADRVFLIQDGKLEASGTHRDLWQTSEAYRRLHVMADAAEPVSAGAG
jgi:ABC-type multidrug transport system fused ATPase/permease subunit